MSRLARIIKWLLTLTVIFVVYMTINLIEYRQPIVSPGNSSYQVVDPSSESNENQGEKKEGTESLFDDVRTLLLFIGYPRSGSTLIGSILDAHPNIVVANEYNLFARWKNFTKEQKDRTHVFNQLWMNSVKEAEKFQRAVRKKFFFSYHVPGAWQGKYSGSIKVIGDKKSTSTTRFLCDKRRNHEFPQIKQTFRVGFKFIHLVRNPFDNIATMTLRAAHPGLRRQAEEKNLQFNSPAILRRQMEIYFRLVDQNVQLRQKFGKDVLDVHYSSFIRQPKVWLKTICDFLEVFCSEDYLNKCIKIVFPKETYTRRHIVWPDSFKEKIFDKIRQVDFLNGLSFDIT